MQCGQSANCQTWVEFSRISDMVSNVVESWAIQTHKRFYIKIPRNSWSSFRRMFLSKHPIHIHSMVLLLAIWLVKSKLESNAKNKWSQHKKILFDMLIWWRISYVHRYQETLNASCGSTDSRCWWPCWLVGAIDWRASKIRDNSSLINNWVVMWVMGNGMSGVGSKVWDR